MKYTREVNKEWHNTTQCYSSYYGLGASGPDPVLDLAHNPMAGGRAEHEREARYHKGWLAPTPTLRYDASEECVDTMEGDDTLRSPWLRVTVKAQIVSRSCLRDF